MDIDPGLVNLLKVLVFVGIIAVWIITKFLKAFIQPLKELHRKVTTAAQGPGETLEELRRDLDTPQGGRQRSEAAPGRGMVGDAEDADDVRAERRRAWRSQPPSVSQRASDSEESVVEVIPQTAARRPGSVDSAPFERPLTRAE